MRRDLAGDAWAWRPSGSRRGRARSGACWTITPAGRLPRRMWAEVRYAGWLSAPWPSTTMTSGSSPSKAATTWFSTSPEQNCGTRASRATPYLPPWMIVVWPVPTMTALMPRSFSACTSRVAVVRLPTAPSVPSTAIRGQVTSKMRPENSLRSFLSCGRRTSVIVTPRQQAGGHELGVVVEEVVQAVDDVHAPGDAVEQHDPLGRREQAVGRRHSADQVVRHLPGVRDGLGQAGEHRDAVGGAVEDLAGVGAGLPAVDDAEDLVLLGVADQPVGGLAVLLAELALAVDDGRAAHREGRGHGGDSR